MRHKTAKALRKAVAANPNITDTPGNKKRAYKHVKRIWNKLPWTDKHLDNTTHTYPNKFATNIDK